MARVTVEDCLEKVENRFALVHLGSSRARHLRIEHQPALVESDNKEIVTALREIAAGHVRFTNAVNDIVEAGLADPDDSSPSY